MVHNVFVWQREKTNAVKALALQHAQEQREAAAHAIASSTHIYSNSSSHQQPHNTNISITNPNLLNSSSPHLIYQNHSHHNHLMNNSNHSFAHHGPVPTMLNHSHVSNVGPYIIRPSTNTPPTPTSPGGIGKLTVAVGGHGGNHREASGSISPGAPLTMNTTGLDMSSVGTTNSPHELSTLV